MSNKELTLTSTKTAIPISILIRNFTDSGDDIHTGFALGYPYSWTEIGSIDKHPIWVIGGKEYTLSILESSRSPYSDRTSSQIDLNLVENSTPDVPLSQLPWDMHVKTDFGSIVFPKSGYIEEDFFLPEHEGKTIQVTFDPPPDKYLVAIFS